MRAVFAFVRERELLNQTVAWEFAEGKTNAMFFRGLIVDSYSMLNAVLAYIHDPYMCIMVPWREVVELRECR